MNQQPPKTRNLCRHWDGGAVLGRLPLRRLQHLGGFGPRGRCCERQARVVPAAGQRRRGPPDTQRTPRSRPQWLVGSAAASGREVWTALRRLSLTPAAGSTPLSPNAQREGPRRPGRWCGRGRRSASPCRRRPRSAVLAPGRRRAARARLRARPRRRWLRRAAGPAGADAAGGGTRGRRGEGSEHPLGMPGCGRESEPPARPGGRR